MDLFVLKLNDVIGKPVSACLLGTLLFLLVHLRVKFRDLMELIVKANVCAYILLLPIEEQVVLFFFYFLAHCVVGNGVEQ